MNKRFSKFMLTSASALALLAAYPSVASTANEALGVNLPSVSVSAAANEDAFVLQVKRLAYNDAIAEMEVLDLTSTSAAVQAARASYNALSASGKANSTVSNWEANLRSKEAAVGAAFVRQVKLLPYVSDIDASDAADVKAVRALYVALPASAKANAAVITWEGHLTSKQAALPETSEIDAFLDAAKALPFVSEIKEMDADELAELATEMEAVRALYDALSDEAKADANVNRWVGFLGDKEKAVEEALTPVEKELSVESVSAINLKTVEVKFNKAVDEDTIDITGTDATVNAYVNTGTTTAVTAYSLSEDGKTLTLALSALNQSDKVKVSIDGVKSTDEVAFPKFEETVTVTDVTAPVASSVEVINHKKVKLHFSEAVNLDTAGIYKTTDVSNSGALVKVDGSLTFAKFTALPEEHAVEVEFFNALADGSHTIEVSEVKDFAGFKAAAKTFTFNTTQDVVAPTATSLEYVSPTSIKVTFNEALKGSTSPTGTFVVKEAGDASDKVKAETTFTLSADKKTVTIANLKPLTAAAIVGYEVTYKNVEDVFGNKLTTDTTISSKVEDDSTKPTVVGTEVLDGNVVKVTFSEKVNASTAHFKLFKADGKTVVNSAASSVQDFDTVNPDKKTFKVTFAGLSNINADNYKVEVANVTDTSIRANVIEKVAINIVAKDSKAPQLSTAVIKPDATGDKDKVELVFSEAMDTTLLSNIANYYVGKTNATVALSNVSGAKVDSVSSDGKKVTLLIPKADGASTGLWASAIDVIALPTLKDQAGNLISNATLASNFSITASYTAITSADIKVEATGKNTVKVTALNGYYFTQADANAFKFKAASSTTTNNNNVDLGVVAAQISADGTSVTLTTSVPLTADAKAEATGDTTPDALKLYISGTGVKDQNGQSLVIADTAAVSSGHTNVQDKIVATQSTPTVGADASANLITVAFDEVVAKASGIPNELLAAAFELKTGSTTLTPVVDYTAAVNSSGKVELTIIKNGVNNADVTVELKKPEYLVDTNSNAVTAISVKTVSAVTEKVAPTASLAQPGIKADLTKLTMTFSEPVHADTVAITNVNDLLESVVITEGNSKAVVSLSSAANTVSWNADKTVATITIPSTAVVEGNVITATIKENVVKDLAGNAMTTTAVAPAAK